MFPVDAIIYSRWCSVANYAEQLSILPNRHSLIRIGQLALEQGNVSTAITPLQNMWKTDPGINMLGLCKP